MLLEKIKSIRSKPPHVRNWYAFVCATLITSCIAGVWVYPTIGLFSHTQEQVPSPQKEVPSSLSRTLGEFGRYAREFVASMKTSIEYVKTDTTQNRNTPTLDLDALYASSTKADMEAQLHKKNTATASMETTKVGTTTQTHTRP